MARITMEDINNSPILKPVYRLMFEGEDITEDVLSATVDIDTGDSMLGSFTTSVARLSLDNANGRFSPKSSYMVGKHNGELQVYATYEGYDEEELFIGFLKKPNISVRKKSASFTFYDLANELKKYPSPSFKELLPKEKFNVTVGDILNTLRNYLKNKYNFEIELDLSDGSISAMPYAVKVLQPFGNCYELVLKLAEAHNSMVYFKGKKLYFYSKLANKNSNKVQHTFDREALHDLSMEYDNDDIYNLVTVKSNYKHLMPKIPVFKTPNNLVEIRDELAENITNRRIKVSGGTRVPLLKEIPRFNLNMTSMEDIANVEPKDNIKVIDSEGRIVNAIGTVIYDAETGMITLPVNYSPPLNPFYYVDYKYEQLVLLAGQSRIFDIQFESAVGVLDAQPIVVAWKNGDYDSETYPNGTATPNVTVLEVSEDNTSAKIEIRNNHNDYITISTLMWLGEPIGQNERLTATSISDIGLLKEYGYKHLEVENDFITNKNQAQQLASWLRKQWEKPRDTLRVDAVVGNPVIDIGLIGVYEDENTYIDDRYLIKKITHNLKVGAWDTKYEVIKINGTDDEISDDWTEHTPKDDTLGSSYFNDKPINDPKLKTTCHSGGCITHTVNVNGSYDIAINFEFTEDEESPIDGFFLYVFTEREELDKDNLPVPNFTPQKHKSSYASDTVYTVDKFARTVILKSVSPHFAYTFGLQAFRKVDTTKISPTGYIVSNIVQPTYADPNPNFSIKPYTDNTEHPFRVDFARPYTSLTNEMSTKYPTEYNMWVEDIFKASCLNHERTYILDLADNSVQMQYDYNGVIISPDFGLKVLCKPHLPEGCDNPNGEYPEGHNAGSNLPPHTRVWLGYYDLPSIYVSPTEKIDYNEKVYGLFLQDCFGEPLLYQDRDGYLYFRSRYIETEDLYAKNVYIEDLLEVGTAGKSAIAKIWGTLTVTRPDGAGMTVTDNLHVVDKAFIGGDLEVVGDTLLRGTLTVEDDTILKGELEVYKDAIFRQDVLIKDDLEVRDDVLIGGNLTVNGDTALEGLLEVDKDATFHSDVTIDDNLLVKGNTELQGTVKFGSDVTHTCHAIKDVSELNVSEITRSNCAVYSDFNGNPAISIDSNVVLTGQNYMDAYAGHIWNIGVKELYSKAGQDLILGTNIDGDMGKLRHQSKSGKASMVNMLKVQTQTVEGVTKIQGQGGSYIEFCSNGDVRIRANGDIHLN